ncbi:unnamed protein product, partial [Didymodactylos carnosus]
FLTQDNLTLWGKCKTYFSSFFKQLSLVSYILFYVGLILRFQDATTSASFDAARIVMGYAIEIWILRALSFIYVLSFLGPHLVAIGKMLKDLLFFMILIGLVMTAYGVASRSIAYQNLDDQNGQLNFTALDVFGKIIYPVYYLMYSDFNNETGYLDAYTGASWSIATHVLLAFHMLFINVLLFNLLIAMF